MNFHWCYLAGGGLGDVYREAHFNGALGILKRWKILHPSEELKIVLMNHTPAAVELVKDDAWTVVQFQFPHDTEKSWEVFYDMFCKDCWGTEIRIHLDNLKSTFHPRYDHLRTNPGPLLWIDPVGCEIDIHGEDRNLTSGLILHPGAGEASRCVTPDVLELVLPYKPLVIGANYPRVGHPQETGLTLPPASLVHTIRRSNGVVGSESSVAYMASMMGIPFVMCYREDQTYDRVQRGLSDWAYYFGEGVEGNLYLKCPLDEEGEAKLRGWLDRFTI